MTLTDFLLARLAEDEWEAQRALSTLTNEINHARLLNLTSTREEILAAPHLGAPIRRMFAEVEAKRRIMLEHPAPSYIGTPGARLACDRCSDLGGPYGFDDPENWIDWPCPTLRAIAAVYVDHPDYQEEWRLM